MSFLGLAVPVLVGLAFVASPSLVTRASRGADRLPGTGRSSSGPATLREA